MRPRPTTSMRADLAGGELSDWVALLASVLSRRTTRVRLNGGRAARCTAYLCSADAVTLGRTILFSAAGWRVLEARSSEGMVLLAHEMAHVAQYERLGFGAFLLIYGREYLAGRLRGWSHRRAYRQISLERQAREAEALAARMLESGALLRG